MVFMIDDVFFIDSMFIFNIFISVIGGGVVEAKRFLELRHVDFSIIMDHAFVKNSTDLISRGIRSSSVFGHCRLYQLIKRTAIN
jgi:hypothetical protein